MYILGYHRLWSHRSYNAAKPLQIVLALAGAGAVQGSIKWWSRSHRAHHRYTDTDLDPYGAHHGFWWSHIGWMLVKPSTKPGPEDIRDLKNNTVVIWQHQWFFTLAFIFGVLVPAVVPGLFWGDWRGGVFFAGFLRLTCVHHVSSPLFAGLIELMKEFRSLHSVSTRWPTGWGTRLLTTS